MKGVALRECELGIFTQFMAKINSKSFFEDEDIAITYYKSSLDRFSYSLDANPGDLYDFVTVVLRDLARGLGFYTTATASSGKLTFADRKPTAFEQVVRKALGTSDEEEAYAKATSGSLPLRVDGYGKPMLYAPEKWNNGLSLNSFVADTTMKITTLLTKDFGTGLVVRDITEDNAVDLFENALGWNCKLPTGAVNSYGGGGSTDDVVPYSGTISVGLDKKPAYSLVSAAEADTTTVSQVDATVMTPEDYVRQYSCGYSLTNNPEAWRVALLLKNGQWDIVYENLVIQNPLSVKFSDLELHYDKSMYDRTVDGHLRCRVTLSKAANSPNANIRTFSYDVHYLVIEELPQKLEMRYSKTVDSDYSNPYLQDVAIGIKNLEGTDYIVVDQTIDGDFYPETYTVTDIKKGYFIATVDKELSTTFKITAYNSNGQTASEVYTMGPLTLSKATVKPVVTDAAVTFVAVAGQALADGMSVTYEIMPVNSSSALTLKGVATSAAPTIDISGLKSGLYVLRFTPAGGETTSVKFVKL